MPYFVAIIVLFILAALGIWVYFTMVPQGRLEDVKGDLEEANLQSNLVDSIEETQRVTKALNKRVKRLRK